MTKTLVKRSKAHLAFVTQLIRKPPHVMVAVPRQANDREQERFENAVYQQFYRLPARPKVYFKRVAANAILAWWEPREAEKEQV